MAVNLSAISSATTAITALGNLVLVSPQKTQGYQPQQNFNDPNNAISQQALLFHYEGEQTASIESDITDHYVEDNTALQDQIALRPEMVTTQGFIGELNDIAPKELSLLKTAADKLTVISAYVPSLSATALIAYNEAKFGYDTILNAANAAIQSISSLNGTGGESVIGSRGLDLQSSQNKQQTYFQQFYGYWRARTLFTVQTPWAVFENMAIKSLRAIQDAETRMISNFEVTFKMIRFAKTNQAVLLDDFQTRAAEEVQRNNPVVQTPYAPPESTQTLSGSIAGVA